ncbi:MAG: response regulator [Spirochaetales bacterium]
MDDTGRTVLLVEDEAVIALAERQTLEQFGYGVVTAKSGEQAVAIAEERSDIDLVLMDIDLGAGIDGTEAADRILSRRDLPLVFLSAHTEPSYVERTERITSYGYIVKHSGETVLLASIRMAFKLFEAHRRIRQQNMRLAVQNEQLRVTNERLEWWHKLMDYVVSHDLSAIAILDSNLRFMYVSARFEYDYRVADQTIVGRHHYEVFPEISRRWREVHRRALAGEVLRSDDDTFERPDGTLDHTRWACRPWYESNGTIGGIILFTQVITEQKRNELRLRRSEKLLHMAERYAGMGSWDMDLSDGTVHRSPLHDQIFGYDEQPEEWTLETSLAHIHPEDRRLLEHALRELEEHGSDLSLECRIIRLDGIERRIRVAGAFTTDELNLRPRATGIVQDITRNGTWQSAGPRMAAV